MEISTEIWKQIPKSPNHFISSMGRVKHRSGRILPQILYKGSPYPLLSLSGNRCRVHRLVAELFIPKVKGRLHVHHKDHNPLNNSVENLEWVTPKQNTQYAAKAGRLAKERPSMRLSSHPRARKVVQKSVPDLRVIKTWDSMTEAANFLGIQQNSINIAVLRNQKGPKHFPHTAAGFVWEYI